MRFLGLTVFILFVTTHVSAQVDTTRTDSTNNIPLFSLNADDLESNTQNQDVSTLLQSSRDVFSGIAGYNFSAARFRMRGYDSKYFTVMMNGVPMNDPERGWAIWSYWGGLNDITRYPEVGNGVSATPSVFGSIGGYSNMDLRASRFRKGTRASYAITNRTYRNRVMLTHSTGMMANGWAFTVSGSTRWSEEGYVEGTYYSGGSYFLSAEKKINEKHSIGLAGFAAPTVQARQGIAVQEAYDLTGNNFYNPYWGYQNGGADKRNARVRNNHRPSAFLTHYFEIDETSKLTSTLYGTFGKTGSTNLNWYDAQDPRPDYYRYLPSYNQQLNPSIAAQQTWDWQNDPSVSQIDWDALYNANYKNLHTVDNANGSGEALIGNRSKYIVEDYRTDPVQIGVNAVYNKTIKEKTYLTGGLMADFYTSHNFKVVEDLLGGDYWVDVDQFAERDFADETVSQNDLSTTNKIAYVGDKIGYNYDMHVNKQEGFLQGEFKGSKVDWYAALNASYTSFWRYGVWANGKFPTTSGGKGEVHNFFNYGAKAGLVYKLTGRHYFSVDGLYQTKAPFSYNSYVSPRTRDGVVPGLESMTILSGNVSYQARFPNFKARATLFYTEVNDQVWARSFYHDVFRNFVNYMMTGVDHLHMGTEIGVEGTIASSYVISAAFTTGQYLYNSRPTATITRDNSSEIMAENRTVYLQNYRIGGMPQTAASIGFKYNSPKYWYAGVSFNYFTDIYLDPNPDRRTEEALDKYVVTDPQWDEMIAQTRLDDGYTLDAYVGKSWKIKNQFIRVNISANNILNNTSFITGGFEQLRYDPSDIGKFPSKFGYMYGTTFFGMVTYLF